MKVVLDLDSHSAIQDISVNSPAGVYQFKSQDTVEWELYFVRGGIVQDLGAGFAIRFGMIQTGDVTNTILAYQTTWNYLTDSNGLPYYSGLVNFNTSQMATAIGTKPSINGSAEVRYQDSLNEIIHTINISTIVYATILVETGVTPPGVSSGYPDASTIELLVHKNAANGYAGLSGSTKLISSIIPVDTQTVKVDTNGNIASAAILTSTLANFTTPAANANVTVTVNSTTGLKASSYVRIPVAGYYVVQSVTDSTHAVLQNNGDPFNAASGVTITTGSVLLPAQAAAGGGSAQSAYTATTASFTVPTSGGTVTVSVGSTAWMGGSGYALFITGAGYYLVNSITDSTHVSVTNSGSAANALPGTNVSSGATVSAAGPIGPTGTTGQSLASYDTTAASFTMPGAAASVTITLTNTTAWMGMGQVVYIAGAGYFSVASIINATTASVTNLNYPGNAASASTIASGAHIGPGGLQGAQGAGGAGLNAFTTLTTTFTQPAVSSNVTVTVGSTAWMAPSQVIYITNGGYYSVVSISDLTHASVTNLGYTGNAAPGATVTATSQAVTPAGLSGSAGIGAFTTLTVSFVMPAALQTVSVTVGSTAFLLQNQNIYIGGAGYFSVSNVVDSTHLTAVNLGSPGNVSSGTTIPVGSGLTVAGATGPAINTTGGFATAADAISTASGTEISHIASQTGGVLALKKLKAGATGTITLTDQGGTTGDILIDASTSGGGTFDPASGVYVYDEFCTVTPTSDPRYNTNLSGGTASVGTYGQGTTSAKIVGCIELATGTSASANQGIGWYWGGLTAPASYPILYGLGALVWKTRIFIEGTLPTTGISYMFRAGIGQMLGSFYGYANNPIQGFFFEYDPGQNSGQWRVAYATSGAATYTNTSVTVTGDAAYWLEIDLNAAWTSLVFKINGTTAATLSSGFPTAVNGAPVWAIGRGTGSTTSYKAAIDAWMLNYTFTR